MSVGYGHLACQTFGGRLATIVFSCLGIPLTLLFIANMGNLLARLFRKGYLRLSEWARARRQRRKGQLWVSSDLRIEPQRVFRSAALSSLFSRHVVSLAVLYRGVGGVARATPSGARAQHVSALEQISKETQRLRRRRDVYIPVPLPLAIFVLYMLLGALLFSLWEGWRFFDSFYFCFITLSTIGFGGTRPRTTCTLLYSRMVHITLNWRRRMPRREPLRRTMYSYSSCADLVPSTEGTSNAQAKLVVCGVWLLVGLSLMSTPLLGSGSGSH